MGYLDGQAPVCFCLYRVCIVMLALALLIVIVAVQGSMQPILSEVAMAMAHKLKSALLSAARFVRFAVRRLLLLACVCVHTCVCACVFVCMYACMVCVCVCVCVYTQTCSCSSHTSREHFPCLRQSILPHECTSLSAHCPAVIPGCAVHCCSGWLSFGGKQKEEAKEKLPKIEPAAPLPFRSVAALIAFLVCVCVCACAVCMQVCICYLSNINAQTMKYI